MISIWTGTVRVSEPEVGYGTASYLRRETVVGKVLAQTRTVEGRYDSWP